MSYHEVTRLISLRVRGQPRLVVEARLLHLFCGSVTTTVFWGSIMLSSAGFSNLPGRHSWLLIGALRGDSTGSLVGIVEVSDRQVGFDFGGRHAAELLLSARSRAAGGRAGRRTIYETVEMIVVKRAPDAFRVEVLRSFAPWLWEALVEASRNRKPTTA